MSATIIGVRFKNSCKSYYFDPKGIDFKEGEGVIVETARGVEYGTVVTANKEVEDKDVVQPLKPVIRKATDKDTQQLKKNEEMKAEALRIATEKILKHKLNMKLVDVEYTFDRNKIIFYFTANGRVDFRDLVKDLASVFRVRIELRQIYERDDTKLRGGLAVCGRPCCCSTYLPDFEKVSIKMAKVQGLSLNPTKISGVCGRLMCCLKFENDYYSEMFKKMPKVGSRAKTPDGEGVVEANDIIRQQVRVKVMRPDGDMEVKTYELSDIVAKVHQSAADTEVADDAELKKLED
jgi:Uncharacterized homolog of PSP1